MEDKQLNKNTTFQLLTLGPGGLLQELFLVISLIKQGFKEFDLIIVEPRLDEEAFKQFKTTLTSLREEKKELKFKIQQYKHMQDIKNNQLSVDLITAIDFESYYSELNDLTLCHRLLSRKGILYLSFGPNNLFFDSQGLVKRELNDSLGGLKCDLSPSCQSNIELLKKGQKKIIKLALTDPTLTPKSLITLFSEINELKLEQVDVDSFMKEGVGIRETASIESIEYFIKMLMPKIPSKKVTIINDVNKISDAKSYDLAIDENSFKEYFLQPNQTYSKDKVMAQN